MAQKQIQTIMGITPLASETMGAPKVTTLPKILQKPIAIPLYYGSKKPTTAIYKKVKADDIPIWTPNTPTGMTSKL